MHYTHHQFDNVAPAVTAPVAGVADYGYCGYPYAGPVAGVGYGGCGTFVLVVVLFILLIIIGCSCGTW
ncbi:YjcZ family sporulation protein [Mesobacillus maritimus]|uniref:YjcZ family sporulation protein n=1 Tax=Mesobacillus maritimus TaxID=1643336 RepID=UPI003D81969E